MALITTIIPTYRRPKLLARAIQSSLAQTFTDLQILVLDNASGDETATVVAEIAKADPRVKYHCHAINIGGLNNFQFGLHAVNTPFFSLLSDDDVILPKFYAASMKAFNENPEASFVACGVLHINPDGRYLGMPVAHLPVGFYRPPDGLLAILRHGHAEWTGILFRSSILQDIGYLNVDTDYAVDLEFELRAAARKCFVVLHEPAAIFCAQPLGSQFGTYPFDRVWPGWPRMIERLMAEPQLSPEVREEVHDQLANRFRDGLLMLGLRYLYQNKTTDAQKAKQVLGHEYNRRFQAGLLKIAIGLHILLGPQWALAFWKVIQKLSQQFKSLVHLAEGKKQASPPALDITPYLSVLQFPTDPNSLKKGNEGHD